MKPYFTDSCKGAKPGNNVGYGEWGITEPGEGKNPSSGYQKSIFSGTLTNTLMIITPMVNNLHTFI